LKDDIDSLFTYVRPCSPFEIERVVTIVEAVTGGSGAGSGEVGGLAVPAPLTLTSETMISPLTSIAYRPTLPNAKGRIITDLQACENRSLVKVVTP